MDTRKLYYEDPHLSQFSAEVLTCEKAKDGFAVILSATAFYPEGGGQAGDTGILNTVRVLDTQEKEGNILHFCDGPLTLGEMVEGTIDYAPRFLRMQQHSGEHMISGILHRRFGVHNTGFHMGSDIITIDFDGVIPKEVLPDIEREANQAVWQNLPVKCWYPSQEELPGVFYRTKRALPWPVRIVQIPGFDSCACCGTHVTHTGEIGLIKLLSVIPFRGGSRMEMACGSAALKLLNEAYDQNKLVSQAFSAKIGETGEAAQKMNDTLAQLKYRITGLEKRIFESIAGSYENCGNVCHFEEGLDSTGIRVLADAIADVCGGTVAVFSGNDKTGYGFCLAAREGDLQEKCKAMTKVLGGRGGGKPQFQQGRVNGTRAQIEGFFSDRNADI